MQKLKIVLFWDTNSITYESSFGRERKRSSGSLQGSFCELLENKKEKYAHFIPELLKKYHERIWYMFLKTHTLYSLLVFCGGFSDEIGERFQQDISYMEYQWR